MKMTLLTLMLIPSLSLATENNSTKDAPRKPASVTSELVQAYVNTADILARARQQNMICDVSAHQSEIIQLLDKARYLEGFDPSMITAATRQALTGTIALLEITKAVDLFKNNTVSEYQKALANAYFEAPAPGAYGPPMWMTLLPGGTMKVGIREVLNEEPWVRDSEKMGTWGVQIKKEKFSDVVRVWFKIGNKTTSYRLERSLYGPLDNGWQLRSGTDKSKGPSKIRFYNGYSSECEA